MTPDFTGNDFCVAFLVCSTCRMKEKMEKKDLIRLMHLQRDELVFNQYQYIFLVRKL